MHPLEAQTVWLLGAAAAGDKDARAALTIVPAESLADINRGLLNMRDALVEKNVELFRQWFPRLFGVRLKSGERATAGVIRAIAQADVEWAVRSVAMATTTLPPDKLIERLEFLAEALRTMHPKEESPAGQTAPPVEK
jgi:hypothetical protein